MRAVILQPAYLPWLGFFDLLDRADAFVLFDTVQHARVSWQARNRVKTKDGVKWLSVPVSRRGRYEQRIFEMETNEETAWREKHVALLRHAYARAPYVDPVCELLEEGLGEARIERLVDVDERIIRALATLIGIGAPLVRASTLGAVEEPPGEDRKSAHLLAICQRVGATDYLAGSAGRDYLDVDLFQRAGVRVEWHDYQHPTYAQQFGDFVPYLSVVDLFMNALPDARRIIAEGRSGGQAQGHAGAE
jgi:hypothetical protein